MMIRRAVYDEMNGLDEALPVGYGDVDLCLRVRAARYRIVYTPYAELYHYESASRIRRLDPRDLGALQQRWGGKLKNDPYYNPNLSLQHNYQLDRWGKIEL
jgi:GT2 family glycosyltransferase